MKRLFRWALYLFLVVLALTVAALLLLNTIAAQYAQYRLRAATGMDVKIGKVDVGLSTPTLAIENVRFYNTAEFGGSPCLDIPEIFVEYDAPAARQRKVHLKLLRVSIAEIDLVQDALGRLNLSALDQKCATAATALRGSSGLTFTGIDTLNLSLQKLRVTTLDAAAPGPEVNLALNDQVFHNIKTAADWRQMGVVLAARGEGAAQANNPKTDLQKLLQQLFHMP